MQGLVTWLDQMQNQECLELSHLNVNLTVVLNKNNVMDRLGIVGVSIHRQDKNYKERGEDQVKAKSIVTDPVTWQEPTQNQEWLDPSHLSVNLTAPTNKNNVMDQLDNVGA